MDDTIFTFHPQSQAAMTRKDDNALPFSMTTAEAVQLLERLTGDAQYHAHFSADPAAALAQLGLDLPAHALGGLTQANLPGQAVLEKALAQLRQGDKGMDKIAMTVLFFLEANSVIPEDDQR